MFFLSTPIFHYAIIKYFRLVIHKTFGDNIGHTLSRNLYS